MKSIAALLFLLLTVLCSPGQSTAGYRDVLISVKNMPVNGFTVNDPVQLVIKTTEANVHFFMYLLNPEGELVHIWERGWIGETKTAKFTLAFYPEDPIGQWTAGVFIWGGSTFDGDGISFPVVQ